MTDGQIPGWERVGTSFDHQCGARIFKRSQKLWDAQTAAGAIIPGFPNPRQASEWLLANDPDFWSVGKLASIGTIGGIFSVSGSYSSDDGILNVWSVPDGEAFPAHHAATFRRLFLRKAVCAKCGGESTTIELRRLVYVEGSSRSLGNYVVCQCGYPVWRMSVNDWSAADDGLNRAERSWNRKLNLIEAGGRHTAKEIDEIRSLQKNRCIYCDALFTEILRPTKDHLLAVVDGGTNWSLNIVLACRSCNSRRCDIPFRTYCKLLSREQNRRIIAHLGRRICAIDFEHVPQEALYSFCAGIYIHDLRHFHYRLILGTSKIARKNAMMNRVMPGSIDLILKRAYKIR